MADKKSQDFDVDFEGENLIIEINDSTFVLSIHNPTQQIWMSSPLSGAHHFEYKESGLKADDLKKMISKKLAVYDYEADMRENKWSATKKLTKANLNELPKYIIDNKNKYS